MNKLASSLLTQEQFWTIIQNSDMCQNLEEELGKLSIDEILGYIHWWDYYHKLSYKQDLWAVAYTVMGGCSDDGFDYFRFWLITRGKEIFTNALQDADSLCDVFTDSEYPEWEEVSYIPIEVLQNKFDIDFYEYEAEGKVIYDEMPLPKIDFEWDEDDEDTIKKICPKTFDKWWNNDKF
ncbi:MAG: DUF4240 domain-containing protein [Defluviitaleaceae bacterium]|nr:DUF4240 domain-containing protein [Defluviitaleaceae bacterium]